MKRACSQIASVTEAVRHLHPPTGCSLKSTPWRQAGLRLNRHAARLAAKLSDSTLPLSSSSLSLFFRLVCRALARKRASTHVCSGRELDSREQL